MFVYVMAGFSLFIQLFFWIVGGYGLVVLIVLLHRLLKLVNLRIHSCETSQVDTGGSK